jgi:hypothetical protein
MREIAFLLSRHAGLLRATGRVRLHRSRVHMPPHFFVFNARLVSLQGPSTDLGSYLDSHSCIEVEILSM